MSYTLHFLNDVFISYASANNAPPGLIAAFYKELTAALRQLGAGKELKVYFDNADIEDRKEIAEQLLSAARSSAVMVAFHSPAYDESTDWCHREFHEFREAREAVRAWSEYLYIVSLNRDSPPSESPVFGEYPQHHHRTFFEVDETDNLWFPYSPDTPDVINPQGLTFRKEVFGMAQKMFPLLKLLRKAAPNRKVFLTCTSDAFKSHSEAIKKELTAQGFHVLQTSPWIAPARRRQDAEQLIKEADLVIGIEEKFDAADAAGEHAKEQLEFARRPEAPKPELRWLPNDNRHGFSNDEIAVRKQRPEVRAVPLVEFNQMVSDRLRGAVVASAPAPVTTTAPVGVALVAATATPLAAAVPRPVPSVVLVCSPDDDTLARNQLLEFLQGLPVPPGKEAAKFQVHTDLMPEVEASNVEAWCRAIKERLSAEHATRVLFLDGQCSRAWIEDRLRRFLIIQRELQLPCAVCDCDPVVKSDPRSFRPQDKMAFLPHNDSAGLSTWIFA